MKTILIILSVLIGIAVIIRLSSLIVKSFNKYNDDEQNDLDSSSYKIKQKYLTSVEQEFYNAIKSIVSNNYILFPQVPLSQIIVKDSNSKYQNELYRVIDFCIFDNNYHPLLCIEINDKSHKQKNRYIRDKKVQNILTNAGLPLITLWTEYGVNIEYIKTRIKEHIKL